MKELHFENLYSPEYYFEIPEYDCRIAITKFIDARDTMGMAHFSLSYIDDKPTTDTAKNFVRTIHLRHAIEDLNNSFDLLMQIPWFFYRIWQNYNSCGNLKTKQLKNHTDIIRNTTDWVFSAEKECSVKKVLNYFSSVSNTTEQAIEKFYNDYIKNDQKNFTIRTLCNTMKHNHALAFEELYEPYNFILNINGQKKNLREQQLGVRFEQNIMDLSKNKQVGKVLYNYEDDWSIDIEYTNSDYFRFSDCTHNSNRLKILDVYQECCEYYDAIIDLFEVIYNDIYPQLYLLETLANGDGKPNIKKSNEKIDLNKYFSIS